MAVKFAHSKFLLLAFLLTIAVIEARNFLPQRTLSITPQKNSSYNYYLLYPFGDNESKSVTWIDKDRGHFRCKFVQSSNNEPCGYGSMFGDDGVHGIDLSKYQYLNISLAYKGSANAIRVAIRSQDPRFSKPKDYNSDKFNFVKLKASELGAPIHIELSEFKVADWWAAQVDLPRSLLRPDLSNAVSITLDIEGDISRTEHEFKVEKVEFSGDYISAERLYFFIIFAWLLSASLFIIIRILYLKKVEKAQQKNISELMASNSSLRRETDKFRRLSTVDALTNAFNRHGIEKIVESLDFRLNSTAVIMFDLDHFKRINDSRGHDAGDRVLQKIGDLVLKNTRNTDNFGRWGGEEFILICPTTTLEMASALAEKLRLVISECVFEPQAPLQVTASFGVTAVLADEPFASAFKRMDEALYRAKHQGRNCVVLAE